MVVANFSLTPTALEKEVRPALAWDEDGVDLTEGIGRSLEFSQIIERFSFKESGHMKVRADTESLAVEFKEGIDPFWKVRLSELVIALEAMEGRIKCFRGVGDGLIDSPECGAGISKAL